eukprot:7697322-Lingulodinium_polyedra.AAC.1
MEHPADEIGEGRVQQPRMFFAGVTCKDSARCGHRLHLCGQHFPALMTWAWFHEHCVLCFWHAGSKDLCDRALGFLVICPRLWLTDRLAFLFPFPAHASKDLADR